MVERASRWGHLTVGNGESSWEDLLTLQTCTPIPTFREADRARRADLERFTEQTALRQPRAP